MARVIVLDFDGTMTDAEAEGAPFRTGYIADIKTLVGAETDEQRDTEDEAEPERPHGARPDGMRPARSQIASAPSSAW